MGQDLYSLFGGSMMLVRSFQFIFIAFLLCSRYENIYPENNLNVPSLQSVLPSIQSSDEPSKAAPLSPRILVAIDPKCFIKAQDIACKLEGHVVSSNSFDALKQQINDLDKNSKNHRIIIDGPVDHLAVLAGIVGYESIQIEAGTDIVQACSAITEKEKTIPVTDVSMRRIDEQTAGQMYQLMIEFDSFLKQHHLAYWVTCGTLLGAVRHRGLIPWDDDLDICMYMHDIKKLLDLKEMLRKRGLEIVMHDSGLYKIFFKDGKKIPKNNQDYYEWTFPAIDIFAVHLNEDNKIVYASNPCKKTWPNEFFLAHELIAPLSYLEFGPLYVPAPRNQSEILSRFYGDDWNDVAYDIWDHGNEKGLKKIKVALVTRSPIPYILPVKSTTQSTHEVSDGCKH